MLRSASIVAHSGILRTGLTARHSNSGRPRAIAAFVKRSSPLASMTQTNESGFCGLGTQSLSPGQS